jgi:peptidoglycan-associated lipoprotein
MLQGVVTLDSVGGTTMRTPRTIIPLAVLLTLGVGVACKKPAPAPAPEAPKVEPSAPKTVTDDAAAKRAAEEDARLRAEEESRRKAEEAALASYRKAAEVVLQDINFDYDKSDIREVDKPKLQAITAFMKSYPQAKLQIEGHCDERGTVEYNLALGERRAHAAQSYLVSLGNTEARLSSISYGKERPKVQGKDDETWLINRRCEFKLQ